MRALEDYDLLGLEEETMRDPYPFYELLLEQAPVFKEPRHGVYIVSRYQDIMEIKRQPERFSNRQATGPMTFPRLEDLPEDVRQKVAEVMSRAQRAGASAPGMPIPTLLGADPPAHGRYRGMSNKLLNPKLAKQWEPHIRAIADELIDGFIEKGAIDWVEEYAHPIPVRTVAGILGVPQDDLKLLDEMFGGSNAGEAIGNPEIALKRMIETPEGETRMNRDTFINFFSDRIKEFRARPREGDFLSDLIHMPDADGNHLNDEEILSIVGHFQVAGHETSTKMMAQAMYQLLISPENMAAVRAEPKLIDNLLEEALRFEAPVQGLFQIANEDVEVGGVSIPAGSMLMNLYAAANRDPAQFECPHKFDIRRANARTHMSFGQGIHFCIGSPFARAEGRIGFQAFLERTRDIRLAPGKNDFGRTVSFVLRGMRELHIEFTPA